MISFEGLRDGRMHINHNHPVKVEATPPPLLMPVTPTTPVYQIEGRSSSSPSTVTNSSPNTNSTNSSPNSSGKRSYDDNANNKAFNSSPNANNVFPTTSPSTNSSPNNFNSSPPVAFPSSANNYSGLLDDSFVGDSYVDNFQYEKRQKTVHVA